ncbi:MAG: metallophosphoesterase, partial [Candidatus Hydrogenedentes bacterium]|nr:metallophosphoesterase [Candidatus Hydrogenedentota bacterium]
MKRIRILHTADLHLDASFASLGVNASLGNKLRAAQRSVFSRIMERARDWPADLVVISGDLFD